jgi:hypothetical protein
MKDTESWVSIVAKIQNFLGKLSNIVAVHDPGTHTLIIYMTGNQVVYLEFETRQDLVNIYTKLLDELLED